MKGKAPSMRTQFRALNIFHCRLRTNLLGTQVLRLTCISAIFAATLCHCNAATADGTAVVAAPTGVGPAAGLDLPPEIINFRADSAGGNYWVLSGTVIDDDIPMIVVQLGGYLQGVTLRPADDGSFSYVFYVPPGQWAYIPAMAIDTSDGQYSNPAQVYIGG